MIKVGIIGVGNMGSKYASLILKHQIHNMEIKAVTRVKPEYEEIKELCQRENVEIFESSDMLFEAVENKKLELDAVIIATPHYSHADISIRAFKNGLHVLCDKPAGVYLRQANNMNEAASLSGKVFGMVFNQRTNPVYIKIKELIESGKYGSLKRVNWVVTNWYRPEKYYSSNAWRATWANDGGGVILNQCIHNLDLLQWMLGMPKKVQAFCQNGRFHNIEVEDDVTAYFEWENGVNGIFITSTGDATGVNRLEITLDEAMLVCENDELRICELEPVLGMKEEEYRKTATDFFKKINGVWKSEETAKEPEPYKVLLQNFADVIEGENIPLVASGYEGKMSLLLSNAIYYSSWKHCMCKLPEAGTEDERAFEIEFEEILDSMK